MRKIIKTILVLFTSIFFASISVSAADYKDVSGYDWYYDSVRYVSEKKIMVGVSDMLFEPEEKLTRGQFAAIIYRIEGSPTAEYKGTFSDVKKDIYYSSAVEWAYSNGIIAGYSEGTFGPEDSLIREQLVAIMYRYAMFKENDVSEKAEYSHFSDGNQVSGYASEAMKWGVGSGIINGYGNGKLAPYGEVTRVECATIITGFLKNDLEQPIEEAVPILLYHHLDYNDKDSSTTISPDKFEQQIQLLVQNGYQSISFEELIAFVEEGKSIPDKSIIITFDDGYKSNYDYALPILKKYNFKATIFVIGSSIGHDYYKDTMYKITPHFGIDEISEMMESGIIDLQSHTYDMHQHRPYETGSVIRENILPLMNESEVQYRDVLINDICCRMKYSHMLVYQKVMCWHFQQENIQI